MPERRLRAFLFQPHPEMLPVRITPRMVAVLHQMATAEAVVDPDPAEPDPTELVYERGAGWWLGLDRIAPGLARALLQAVALRKAQDSRVGVFERYTINETGRRVLALAGRATTPPHGES